MLTQLDLAGVRNLEPQTISLSSRVTLLSGANAQGKSSLLEAVYWLGTTRSFRTKDPRTMIAASQSTMYARGRLESRTGVGFWLGISLGRGHGERHLSVGESAPKLMDYLGVLPVLFQGGESVRSIAESAASRRRTIDRATAAADPSHLRDLTRYQQALLRRNRVLKASLKARQPDRELEPWEQILAESGEPIRARRQRQIEAWQSSLGAWPELFPEGREARLNYRVSVSSEVSGSTALKEHLAAARTRDRLVGATTVGPHRDDFSIELEGRDLLSQGSAGQIRAALSALTLSQARSVRMARPDDDLILLLDDLDSDLDPERCHALLAAAEQEGQVLAATSKPELVKSRGLAAITMQAGTARAIAPQAGA